MTDNPFGPYRPPPEPPPADLWAAWGTGRMWIWAAGLLFTNLMLQSLFFLVTGQLFVSVLFASILGILTPCHLVARSLGGSLTADFQLGWIDPQPALWAALAALGALVPTSFLASLSIQVYPVSESWLEFQREHMPDTPLETAGVLVTVAIVIPAAEELLFRGIVHRLLRHHLRPWLAGVLSALAFGLVHFEPWYFLGLFGLGLLLAFVYETTRSVTACAVTHGVHNAVSLVFLAEGESEAPATGTPTGEDIQLLAGSLLLLGFACSRLLRSGTDR